MLVPSAQTWGNAPPPYGFTEQRQLLVVDRRRHGASGDTPGEYTSDYLVDAGGVTALLERVGGAHLVGHSYGGVPAMLAAPARPT